MDGVVYVIDQLGRNISQLAAENDRLKKERDELQQMVATLTQADRVAADG